MQTLDDDQSTLEAAHETMHGEADEVMEYEEDRVYHPRKSVDEELQEMVDLLNIPLYALDRLSVRRVIGVNKTDYCFDFAPADLPITERVRRTCGPGDYQIWILKEKKTFHKRLKLHVSQDEALRAREMAARDRGQRSGGVQQDRGHQDRGQQNGRGRGNRRGNNQGIQQEMADLKRQISAMQTGVQAPANTGTGITHTDLIAAEERGYKRAKETFDIQLSSVKEHHQTQLTMIKESKGIESYLADDGEDEGGMDETGIAGIIKGLGDVIAPISDAIAPFAEGYRTQKETEHVIARKQAGLPPEPEIEPEKNDETVKGSGGKPSESPVVSPSDAEKIFNTVTSLFAAAAAGESPHDHADAILHSFDKQTVDGVFLAPNTLDGLFSQREDLVQYRPWFEDMLKEMRAIIAKIAAEKLSAEPDPKTAAGTSDEKNIREDGKAKSARTDNGDEKKDEGKEEGGADGQESKSDS